MIITKNIIKIFKILTLKSLVLALVLGRCAEVWSCLGLRCNVRSALVLKAVISTGSSSKIRVTSKVGICRGIKSTSTPSIIVIIKIIILLRCTSLMSQPFSYLFSYDSSSLVFNVNRFFTFVQATTFTFIF